MERTLRSDFSYLDITLGNTLTPASPAITRAGPSQGISIDGWQQLALSKIDTRQFLTTIGIA